MNTQLVENYILTRLQQYSSLSTASLRHQCRLFYALNKKQARKLLISMEKRGLIHIHRSHYPQESRASLPLTATPQTY